MLNQLLVGAVIAACGFAAVMLLGAPRRVLAIIAQLHKALSAPLPIESAEARALMSATLPRMLPRL